MVRRWPTSESYGTGALSLLLNVLVQLEFIGTVVAVPTAAPAAGGEAAEKAEAEEEQVLEPDVAGLEAAVLTDAIAGAFPETRPASASRTTTRFGKLLDAGTEPFGVWRVFVNEVPDPTDG